MVDVNIYDTNDPTEMVPITNAVIGVFSYASRESFRKLQLFSSFFSHFRENGGLVCLVGTHTDVEPPQVSQDASKMAHDIGARLFAICVDNSHEARAPWDFLLHQHIQPVTERVLRAIETPAPPTTPTETIITSTRNAWSHWLDFIGKCFAL